MVAWGSVLWMNNYYSNNDMHFPRFDVNAGRGAPVNGGCLGRSGAIQVHFFWD